MRKARIERKSKESDIALSLYLEGQGQAEIDSGCGFLDHMLRLFAMHGHFDLKLRCAGDTQVDYHHSCEDIGICLGKAFLEALGDKRGITRYADTTLVMDESLVLSAVDISGRGGFFPSLQIPASKVGDFDTELCEEFFFAFCRESGISLHLRQLAGKNSHHIIEACFKATARSLQKAVQIETAFSRQLPSSKGIL